jgi:hypothetical protein
MSRPHNGHRYRYAVSVPTEGLSVSVVTHVCAEHPKQINDAEIASLQNDKIQQPPVVTAITQRCDPSPGRRRDTPLQS